MTMTTNNVTGVSKAENGTIVSDEYIINFSAWIKGNATISKVTVKQASEDLRHA
jgi:hypothetical protein